MKSQKLGRGLDALLGEMDEAYENESTARDAVIELSVKDIRPNPYQPRKHFDENSLLELGESIKHDGLLQPIVVTQDFDGYVLIAGERRLRASKLVKLKTIRAILLNSDEQKMRQFALIENIQRDELNAVELAEAYSELIKMYNVTQEELASKIHKSRTHITNTIRLLQLSVKTQRALVEKKITAGHAKVLIGLDEKEQQIIVNSIIGQKLSVREVEAIIKNIKDEKKPASSKSQSNKFDFSEIMEKFDSLGLRVKTSSNKLTIEFDNESQISNLLEYISK
ncbi:MAG: ParB/RepB/Spo0J family partition protein [Sulfurimonas sp.]|nr:ParB/RepB/Spo0J family partition protein [Sulfurimonas sp.]MDD3834125.1 ParB/RepB/Spo0J family partition protein [Sulfurimonas sp.]